VAEISLAREQQKQLEEQASNKYHRVYFYNEGIDSSTTVKWHEQLAVWTRTEPGCAFELVFSSPAARSSMAWHSTTTSGAYVGRATT